MSASLVIAKRNTKPGEWGGLLDWASWTVFNTVGKRTPKTVSKIHICFNGDSRTLCGKQIPAAKDGEIVMETVGIGICPTCEFLARRDYAHQLIALKAKRPAKKNA